MAKGLMNSFRHKSLEVGKVVDFRIRYKDKYLVVVKESWDSITGNLMGVFDTNDEAATLRTALRRKYLVGPTEALTPWELGRITIEYGTDISIDLT